MRKFCCIKLNRTIDSSFPTNYRGKMPLTNVFPVKYKKSNFVFCHVIDVFCLGATRVQRRVSLNILPRQCLGGVSCVKGVLVLRRRRPIWRPFRKGAPPFASLRWSLSARTFWVSQLTGSRAVLITPHFLVTD